LINIKSNIPLEINNPIMIRIRNLDLFIV